MGKKVLLGLIVAALFFSWQFAFCEEKELPQDKIIAIATQALKDAGIDVIDVKIVFDENGKLWCENSGFVGFEDKSANHGILKRGFLKNYRIVYFDFKEPLKDVWVFIDKDTGEVLTYLREQ